MCVQCVPKSGFAVLMMIPGLQAPPASGCYGSDTEDGHFPAPRPGIRQTLPAACSQGRLGRAPTLACSGTRGPHELVRLRSRRERRTRHWPAIWSA